MIIEIKKECIYWKAEYKRHSQVDHNGVLAYIVKEEIMPLQDRIHEGIVLGISETHIHILEEDGMIAVLPLKEWRVKVKE